jgi:DNA polymerase III subunit epsilon
MTAQHRQIVLDTETTGLNPEAGHRVIEIGCIEMVDRQLTGNHLHLYLNPDRDIDVDAMKVHGISNEFLQDKPRFSGVVKEFIEFIRGAELIIHNAPFDIGFLNHELSLCDRSLGSMTDYSTVIDTLVMARNKHAGQRNSLDALCQRYSVDNSNRELHGALLDSELLAKVYLAMTGGQTMLFAEASSDVKNGVVGAAMVKRMDGERLLGKVVVANDEEMSQHKAYLKMLAERGQCVWNESE